MSQATIEETHSDSQDSYWETEQLPPAELTDEPPVDNTELINPPEKTCPVCHEEIIREPGSRGRLPKYHPDCRPSKASRTPQGPRPVRVTAKDRAIAEQVEETLAQYEAQMNKLIIMLAVADPYDALVLKVNTPELLNNLRPILMRFPILRDGASTASLATAIFNLALTACTIILPIAAHHKIIPQGRVAQFMLNIPLFMLRIQENMANGSADLTDSLLQRVREQAAKERENFMRTQAESGPVDATPTR